MQTQEKTILADPFASVDAAPLSLVERPAQPVAPVVQQPATVITPADLLRIAMESGDKDIERLERLMSMDERYRESQERERKRQAELAFRRDFALLRGENVIVPKSKYVDRGKAGSFMQAEYGVVADMLSPVLSKHGFGFRHDVKFGSRPWITDGVENTIAWVFVTCFLEHRDGHIEKLDLEGPPGELHANTPVQNMQATASYLKRQSLLAITGTATADEDDETRMRRVAGDKRGEQPQAPADEAQLQALLDAGYAEANKGSKAVVFWWGKLTDDQRTLVMPHFGAIKAEARKHDGGAK